METSIEKRVRVSIKAVCGDIGQYAMGDELVILRDKEAVRKIAAMLDLQLTPDDLAGIRAAGDFVDLMT